MPRSGVSTAHATGSQIPWSHFVRLDLASTYRYTDLGQDATLSIDGSSQLWSHYPIQVPSLSQSSKSPLDVSFISIGNLDGLWSARAFGAAQFRELPVFVYVVQFDPATWPNTLTILGQPKMFEGRTAGADLAQDGWLKITLNPHSAAWNRLSLHTIGANCPYDYKGPECGYVGALATCARNRSDCVTHANTARFGGADWMSPVDIILAWGTLTATIAFQPPPAVVASTPPGVLGTPSSGSGFESLGTLVPGSPGGPGKKGK